MNVSDYTIQNLTLSHWTWTPESAPATGLTPPLQAPVKPKFDWLKPLRQRLDNLEISDREFAHLLCKLIPSQCPFERTIKLFGHTVFHIPPLCKLNPLYEEVVGLRFRALCYLADQCGEDVSIYC
ncbi:MAG TPA: Mo-dependent nitrogenase C-terminal domain-containing protein [Chroococcidiopsis sp.]